MIVAGRLPSRNKRICSTKYGFCRPARLSIEPLLRPVVPWQFAQLAATYRIGSASAFAIAAAGRSAQTVALATMSLLIAQTSEDFVSARTGALMSDDREALSIESVRASNAGATLAKKEARIIRASIGCEVE